MAAIRKRGKSWQAIVRLKGYPPVSATRATKREAEEWAKAEEGAILSGRRGKFPGRTLGEALTKYEESVSSQKRGEAFESKRFAAMRREFPALVAKVLHQITAGDLAGWRDKRLAKVTKGTVQRDINLFRNVWSVAAREWGWCDDGLWKSVRMPGDNPARRSTWRWQDARLILRRLGYRTGQPPMTVTQDVGYLFLLGLHTAMRQGELCSMTRESVDLERRVITLATHKTMESVGARRVPITARAARVLRVLVGDTKTGPLVKVTTASTSALFRKYMAQMGISGLTFHDSRATAATLLSRRRDPKSKQILCDPLTLARILGHANLTELIRTYYREDIADIAARI